MNFKIRYSLFKWKYPYKIFITIPILVIFVIWLIGYEITYIDYKLFDYYNITNNPKNLSKYYSDKCIGKKINENMLFSNNYKIHIMYIHYLETTDEKSIENFKYFMDFAYEPCSKNVDFTFIFHTDHEYIDVFKEIKKIIVDDDLIYNIKNCKNTRIKYRLNEGNYLCAFIDILKSDYWKLIENVYQFYFFINSSVRGPFLPVYWTRPW